MVQIISTVIGWRLDLRADSLEAEGDNQAVENIS